MIPHYNIKYTNRKTISIRISRTGELIVSAPIGIEKETIHKFVQSKEKRIITKINYVKNQISDTTITISKQMKERALIQIIPRIEYYAKIMNVSYTDLKITTAQTKRGSCSSRGILMFHWKLSQFPIKILDYVIVHELAHLIHFNHSPSFWNLVEQYHPTYKESKKRLQENGNNQGLD